MIAEYQFLSFVKSAAVLRVDNTSLSYLRPVSIVLVSFFFFALTTLHFDVFLQLLSIEKKHFFCCLVESEYGQIKDFLQVSVSITGISQDSSFLSLLFLHFSHLLLKVVGLFIGPRIG